MKKKLENKTNSVKRKRSKTSKSENETTETLKAEVLDFQGLREGMVLLGCITEVRPNGLLVSLPGCLVGNVPLTNISSEYTEVLLRSTGNEEREVDVADLSSLVEVGATYPCKVLKVTLKEHFKKPSILLSLDPQVVNSELRLQSLYLKMVLHASVQSVEDHGYIMDVGVPGIQGFLPFSTSSGIKNLALGQIVPTSVRKLPSQKKGNVVWLSKISNDDPFPEIEDDSMALTSILPGAHVTAYITDVKQPFIYMKCMSFNACSNMMSLGTANQNLSEETKVSGTVLYVHPISHMIYLHLGPKPTPGTFLDFFRYKKFDFAKNVKYQYFWHHRILFKMNKGAMGFLQKGELPERGFLSQASLSKNPVIPKGRVVFLHYMDNLVQLSFNESTINMEIIKLEDVQIGDIYEATVSRHIDAGMFVKVCPGFSGFVRDIHLSDSLVSMPEKLFPVGAKVKCRIVSLHPSFGFNMSCKVSLVSVAPSNLLKSYEEVQKDASYKGVIVQRVDTHMLVLFFNEIKGVVPSEEIPESSVFFVGQTVSCRVLLCDPKKKKLKLSLMSDVRWSKTSKKAAGMAEMFISATKSEIEPNKIQKAIIQSINGNQLNVVLNGGKRGRVHVTEIGNAREGDMPLKDFRLFQRIRVHRLSSYEARSRNYLQISHRRSKQYSECALSLPPPSPLHAEFLPGMDVTGYVKEASSTSCTLWLSPVQTATLDYLHISENPKELRKLKKKLKPGLALKAKVFEVEKMTKEKESYYNITLTKLDDQVVRVGRNVVGLVQIASPEKGLVLRLPHGYHGTASLSDLQDLPAAVHGVLDRCRKLLFVLCHVMEVNRTTKFCVLSLRKSRLYDVQPSSEDSYPEVTPSTLAPGASIKGFVKMSQHDHLIVNFGRMLDGRVDLHRCDTRGCGFCGHTKNVIKKYPPGDVIEVVLDGVAALKNLYPLSLPELDGLGLSQESRLSVAEDIDWEEV